MDENEMDELKRQARTQAEITAVKLEAMVNLFRHATTEAERRLLLICFVGAGIEMVGGEAMHGLIDQLVTTGIRVCAEDCEVCDAGGHGAEASDDTLAEIFESLRGPGCDADGDDCEDEDEPKTGDRRFDDWDEVIH